MAKSISKKTAEKNGKKNLPSKKLAVYLRVICGFVLEF
jgi:hypothetical protein